MAVRPIAYLKNKFLTGLKPLQEDFHDWLDSFWNKGESIPASSISGLSTPDLQEVTDQGSVTSNDVIVNARIKSIRCLVGAAVVDDGASTLQVNGSIKLDTPNAKTFIVRDATDINGLNIYIKGTEFNLSSLGGTVYLNQKQPVTVACDSITYRGNPSATATIKYMDSYLVERVRIGYGSAVNGVFASKVKIGGAAGFPSFDGLQVEGATKLALTTYATDSAADADSTLPSGGLYLKTGGRTVYQKP